MLNLKVSGTDFGHEEGRGGQAARTLYAPCSPLPHPMLVIPHILTWNGQYSRARRRYVNTRYNESNRKSTSLLPPISQFDRYISFLVLHGTDVVSSFQYYLSLAQVRMSSYPYMTITNI
jgi:hypothetical protein